MNTVLDDNKKLCLNSGQILALTENVTMMFEVEDLLVASPATVSRCGMVYLESTAMGYKPILYKYLHSTKIPKLVKDRLSDTLFKKSSLYIEGTFKLTLKEK